MAQQVTVGDQPTINVTLPTDTKTLDEVVVTALGVKKETRKIGYAVQEVNGEDLVKARDPNPISGLTGKVAGLSVGPVARAAAGAQRTAARQPAVAVRRGRLPD